MLLQSNHKMPANFVLQDKAKRYHSLMVEVSNTLSIVVAFINLFINILKYITFLGGLNAFLQKLFYILIEILHNLHYGPRSFFHVWRQIPPPSPFI
jgi:hypothetical protein